MGWWHGSWGWGGWLLMTFLMVTFWAAVIWIVGTLLRGTASGVPTTDPESILAERFARGEIDVDEYHARLETLRSPDRQSAGQR